MRQSFLSLFGNVKVLFYAQVIPLVLLVLILVFTLLRMVRFYFSLFLKWKAGQFPTKALVRTVVQGFLAILFFSLILAGLLYFIIFVLFPFSKTL